MTHTIRISDSLTLPADAVTQPFAFLARRGAGKSYGSMKLAEGMLDAGAQIVAIDPVGVWYSLRIAADGKGKGYDLPILGGLHGDIPLEPGAGALIADLIVDRCISAVLDVSMFRKNERKQFATAFAEQFFHRKKQHRSPVHIFVEEAQVFVPQRAMGDEARMLGAFEDLVKLGRNFGIGVTLISQRPQSVNKDALNQTEALFVLQTNGAQERKALENWIVEQGVDNKKLVDELPGLPIGTAYLWSPSWLHKLEKIKIGKRKTYDASATPTPGMERAEPRALSQDELADVERAMAATIAKAKADDPKELRRQIADLQRQVKAVPAKTETVEKRVEVPVLPESTATELREIVKTIGAALDRFTAVTDQIQGALARVQRPASVVTPPPPRTTSRPAAQRERTQPPEGVQTFRAGAVRMLKACAQFEQRGLTRSQLVALAGVQKGGTFSTYIGELLRAGLVEERDGRVYVTPEGMNYLGADVPPQPTTADEVLGRWRGEFRAGAQRMLDIIVEAYPRSVSRADLSDRAGIEKGGTFSTYLGELKRAELVQERGDGLYAVVLDLVL